VPLLADAWEPAIVVNYPIEPSSETEDGDGYEVPEGSDEPGRPEAAVAREDRRDEADAAFPPAVSTRSSVLGQAAGDAEEPAEPEPAAHATRQEEGEDADPTSAGEAEGEESAPAVDAGNDQPTTTVEAGSGQPEDVPLPLDLPEQPAPPAPAPKPARRKRASVPSWDEIVFGGPKDS
jgi:hypothetical protein